MTRNWPFWAPGAQGFLRAPHGIEEFVILSILLHLLFILMFGAPAGGSREGRSMWGSMRVVLMEVVRPAEPQLKLDRGSSSLLPGLEPPKRQAAPPPPPPLPRAEQPAPVTPQPVSPPEPAPAPPAATAPPAAESPAFVPPILDRLAPEAPKAPTPQPTFQVPPPSPPPPVPVPTPEPVAPPIALPSPMPAPAAAPVIESPPVIERAPVPTPAVPVPAPAPVRVPPPTPPIERAPIQTPVLPTPPVERAPPVPAPVLPTPPAERAPLETPALPKQPVVTPIERAPAAAPATPSVERSEPRVEPAPPPAPAPRAAPRETPAPPKADPAPGASPFRPSPQLGDFPKGRDAYDPTRPGLDAESLRDRARSLAREGAGNRAPLPFPMPPKPVEKTQLEKAIEAARKPDCDKAYAGMGLLAIVPLIANEFGEGKCRWR